MTFIEHTREPREFGAASFSPASDTGVREMASQFNTTRKSAHVCLPSRPDAQPPVRLHMQRPTPRCPRETRVSPAQDARSRRLGACPACGLHVPQCEASCRAPRYTCTTLSCRVPGKGLRRCDRRYDASSAKTSMNLTALGKGGGATVEVRPAGVLSSRSTPNRVRT
jgi:hypothetical protein